MFLCVCLVARYVRVDSGDGFRRYVEGVVLERSPARLAIVGGSEALLSFGTKQFIC
jgi:hypothetical protein